jgi:HSP20 family protein
VAVNLYENDHSYQIRAELPGFKKEEIAVEVNDSVLRLKATPKEKEQNRGFERTITLPDEVVLDKIGAQLENGVLTITIPKKEEAKPKRFEIEIK